MNQQMIYCFSTTLAHATPSNQGKSMIDKIITRIFPHAIVHAKSNSLEP